MSDERMPRLSAVALAQLDLLIRTKYLLAIVVLPLFCLGIMHRITPAPGTLPPWMIRPVMSTMYLQLIFVGGAAAMLVWVYDSPRNRRYHWAMPVRREVHDVMRVLAGAIWLVVAIAMVCAVGWFAEDRVIRDQWLIDVPLYWLGLFLVPLLTYLLTTIAALLTGKPALWVAGGVLLIVVLLSNPVANAVPPVTRVAEAVFSDQRPPSLGSALSGGYQIAPWNDQAQRKRVFDATSTEYFERNRFRPRAWHSAPIAGEDFPLVPRSWLLSLLLWFTVAMCGIALAVRRRPDV